jgi:hypothetical protein
MPGSGPAKCQLHIFSLQSQAAVQRQEFIAVSIFDGRSDRARRSIVYFAEVSPMHKAGGKWNTFEITAKGRNITVLLNGKQTVNLHNGMFNEGHFTLQYGTGVVKFRKVAVKPL